MPKAHAAGSTQGFLCLTNVSTSRPDYSSWSPLLSVEHTIEVPDTNSAARHGAFWVEKPVDRSSPRLAELCNKGTKTPQVKLDFLEARASGVLRYYQVTLSNVVVVSYGLSSDSSNMQDRAGLAYARADWTYTEYTPQGTPVGDWTTWWSVVANSGGAGYERSFRLQMTANGKSFHLVWPSKAGVYYEIQSSATPDGPYSYVDKIQSAGDGETAYDLPSSQPQQFFQVIERAN